MSSPVQKIRALIQQQPRWARLLIGILVVLTATAVVVVSTNSIINTSHSDKSITSMVDLIQATRSKQITISQTKVPALPNTTVTVVNMEATALPNNHLLKGTCRDAWFSKDGVEILPCGYAKIDKGKISVTSTLYVNGNAPYAAAWFLWIDPQDPDQTIKDRNLVICSIPDGEEMLHACEISVLLEGLPSETTFIAAGTVSSSPSIPGSYASPHYTGTSSTRFQATPE